MVSSLAAGPPSSVVREEDAEIDIPSSLGVYSGSVPAEEVETHLCSLHDQMTDEIFFGDLFPADGERLSYEIYLVYALREHHLELMMPLRS